MRPFEPHACSENESFLFINSVLTVLNLKHEMILRFRRYTHDVVMSDVKWRMPACVFDLFQEKSNPLTSVLQLLGPVVGTVLALHAEVDVGADAAVVQRLDRTHVITHAEEDLRRLVLAEQPHGVHLQRQRKDMHLLRCTTYTVYYICSNSSAAQCIPAQQYSAYHSGT